MPTLPARVRPRFLAPDLEVDARDSYLPADESRHLTRVLRLGPGAVVSVFDGRGREYLAEVAEVRDARVRLAILEPIAPAAEPAVPLTLVQGLLKGSAMDDVVRDATMMGATVIRPVLTGHVAVKPALATRAENVERWRRVAVASAKQSRRATVPEVHPVSSLGEALAAQPSNLRLLFVEPSAERPTRPLRALLDQPPPSGASLLIGPEGGWTVEEIALAEAASAMLVSLGSLTLRADAAPIAAFAVVRALWDTA
jgi:16S rRNA (uracil1498-N3)-methyltransferase